MLECRNLTLGYDGNAIVKDLNFRIEDGEYVCIIGENGSGKSTLMKTLLGLQKPMSGEIVSDGVAGNGIGYLPQQTAAQKDFPASVYEIVISGFCGRCGISPFYSKDRKREALKNIEKMGISHLTGRCYRELSGGQQQRVLLARALCATEKMLLLDEPVSGLDPNAAEDMYSLIERLNKDDKTTVIMITHDISAALKYADKILHIGKDIFFGSKEEYIGIREGDE